MNYISIGLRGLTYLHLGFHVLGQWQGRVVKNDVTTYREHIKDQGFDID
jgi:hypothetical protein